MFFSPDYFGPPWWFFIIPVIIIAVIVTTIVKGLATWMSNNASPITSVPATVIGKRTRTSGGGNDSSVHTSYYITFELERGERIELQVAGNEYGLLVERDSGTLTYQGTRYKGFSRRLG